MIRRMLIVVGMAAALCNLPATRALRAAVPAWQTAVPGGAAKQLGTIKTISGNTLTLATDSGLQVAVQVPAGIRIVRVEPGQTSLKDATPIRLMDLAPGDRILVSGRLAEDSKSLIAAFVVAMKRTDVQARQEREREEWQRGAGGLVSSVDPTSGTITISVTAAGGRKTIAIHTTAATSFRRYAPDSVKFDDAKPSSVNAIRPGDQVRARGERSADGSEFNALAVVSGSFRNIAGTVASTNPAGDTLTVKDLATKKNVVVKITPDSNVRKLPPQVAQFIAMRLRGQDPGASAKGGDQATGRPAPGNGAMANHRGGMEGGMGHAGVPDFQQILDRMPRAQISDLQKGDAVMIVSTEGAQSGAVTAITLLAGVEPILEAPGGRMTLSPWTLGGTPSGGDETGGGTPQP